MTKETRSRLFPVSERIELAATVMMALAAIFTAWAAFESAKWSGIQAIDFAQAGSARTESTRFDTMAGQQSGVDVAIFMGFISAINEDANQGLVDISPGTVYSPTPGTLSGFIYERVRDEFRPAFDAWLVEFFSDRENAPPTPFAMEEYELANRAEAQRYLLEAQGHYDEALQANQNSDNYVLTVVAFALVLFFAGVSSKLEAHRNRLIAISVGGTIFIGASIALFALPKIWPWG